MTFNSLDTYQLSKAGLYVKKLYVESDTSEDLTKTFKGYVQCTKRCAPLL